jgi:hypothetical protein
LTDAGGSFIYYTVALYAFSYGMTDERKPSFKITLTLSNTTLAQANAYSFDVFSRFKAAPDYYDNWKQPQLDFEATKEEDDWEQEEKAATPESSLSNH